MEFRLLGPLEVIDDHGTALSLGGARQRQVLAALLLHRNSLLVPDRVVDAVWGDAPPPSAAGSLQAYVSRLRSLVGDGRLPPASVGYTIKTSPEEVDADCFEDLVRRARSMMSSDPEEAVRHFDTSLALFRGAPLAEFAYEDFAQPFIQTLEQQRLDVVEDRVDALLALGRHRDLVAELATLTGEQPLRERRWEQLMVALYRCGRQADALRAFQTARSHLIDQLGIEPSPGLRRIEELVLSQSPELELPKPAETPTAVSPAQSEPAEPNRRPAAVPLTSFVGRDEEVRALVDELRVARIVTLLGPAGVGKSRLALETVSRGSTVGSRSWFVDVLDCEDEASVLVAIAEGVGAEYRLASSIQGEIARRLAPVPGVLVVDNCEQVVGVIAPILVDLLGQAPDLTVLATSRRPLGVPGETHWRVRPLPVTDQASDGAAGNSSPAVKLLADRARQVISGFRVDADNESRVLELCRTLDGLPLAIELAANHLRSLPLEEIETRLLELPTRSAVGSSEERTLEGALRVSYSLLPLSAQLVLPRLSVFSGGFDIDTVKAVCSDDDVGPDQMAAALTSLVDESLLQAESSSNLAVTYRLIGIIRRFGRSLAAEAGEADVWARRHAEHFAGLASLAGSPSQDSQSARASLVRYEGDLRSAGRWAEDNGRDDLVGEIARALVDLAA